MAGVIELKCDESKIDEEGMKKQEKEDEKVSNEIELFNFLKNYIDVLNREKTCQNGRLKVITTGMACEVTNFSFIIYAARRWPNFLVDGFAKYIEEKYDEIVQRWTIPCEFIVTEAVPAHLYMYRFLIDSMHERHISKLFYHNVPKPISN